MNKYILSITALLALGACAPTPEQLISAGQQRQAVMTDATIDKTPAWFLEIPEKGVFSNGTARSADLQSAFDNAIINAKVALADRVDGKLNATAKSHEYETTGPNSRLSQTRERTVKNSIIGVETAGYKIVKKAVIQDMGAYRAFVRLEYPSEDNDILQQKQDQKVVLNAKKAYAELEDDIERAKAEPPVPDAAVRSNIKDAVRLDH